MSRSSQRCHLSGVCWVFTRPRSSRTCPKHFTQGGILYSTSHLVLQSFLLLAPHNNGLPLCRERQSTCTPSRSTPACHGQSLSKLDAGLAHWDEQATICCVAGPGLSPTCRPLLYVPSFNLLSLQPLRLANKKAKKTQFKPVDRCAL